MNLPRRAETLIIGAGIQGLLLAFNLADRGKRDILVLDAGYWQGGASGRNGTLIRGGFSSAEWTAFFSHSIEEWKRLSARLGQNVMYSPRGYAIVAESETTRSMLDQAYENQLSLGVKTEILSEARLREVLPAIDHNRIKGTILLKDGGTAPHHAVMKGALHAARNRGVSVHYQTKVTGLETTNGRVSGVLVGDHRIEADLTIIAAGAHSTELAGFAGAELDAMPFRIEAAASEPLRPLIYPAIALIDRMTYLHQTARGEIVGGCEIAGESAKDNIKSTAYVLPRYARSVVEMFPQATNLRILRQWSGMIHPAPDGGPMLGPHPDIDGLWFSAGWTYGIAGAPGAADLMAKAIVTGEIDSRMAAFSIDRFRRGKPCIEASAVIDNASAVA